MAPRSGDSAVRQVTFAELVDQQDGVVSRAQAVAAGLTPAQIRANLAARRWQRLMPGVYATFTGPLTRRVRAWAAVLAMGDGAALTGRTALWLHGAVPDPGNVIQVVIPHGRVVRTPFDVDVRRCRHLAHRLHPVALPPMVRVEEALLDATENADEQTVIGLVLQVLQRRVTTPERIAAALDHRARHRHRRLLGEVLRDASTGTASLLEHRYLRDVERRHGLPPAERNQLVIREVGTGSPRRTRPDLRYGRWGLVVELDGVAYHPEHLRHLDRLRDNETALAGERTLRAGWHEVVTTPCRTASQVGLGLRRGGWRGLARRCGPDCTIDPSLLTPPA